MKHLKQLLIVLFVFVGFAAGQFGAGSALYMEDDIGGTSFAYSYPWTGVAESGTTTFTVELWVWVERWKSDHQGFFLSVMDEEDDNYIALGKGHVITMWSYVFYYIEAVAQYKERQWLHYALVYDIKDPDVLVTYYINGIKVGIHVPSEYSKSHNSAQPWAIVLGGDQDSILGKFNPAQMSAGLFDNLRIWDKKFTQAEVSYYMSHAITPTTPGLLSAWNFDEGTGISSRELVTGRPSWAFYFGTTLADPKDLIAHNYDKYKADVIVKWGYSGARCRGSGLTMAAAAGVKTTIRFRDLTDTGSYVITSMTGGSLFVEGTTTQILVGQTVTTNVTYVAPATISTTDQRITFRVGSESQTITLKNSPPIVPRDVTVSIPEDSDIIDGHVHLSEAYDNPNGWETAVMITKFPDRGTLYYQTSNNISSLEVAIHPNMPPKKIPSEYSFVGDNEEGYGGWNQLLFQPNKNEFSTKYTQFEYVVVDKARMSDMDAIKKLPTATVYVKVPPSNDFPSLTDGKVNFTTNQNAEVVLQYSREDFDGDDVNIELVSLPSNGDLWLADNRGNKIRKLTKSAAGVKEIEQYATQLIDFSSEYPGETNGGWKAIQILGPPPKKLRFGDTSLAWAPSTTDNKCQDIGTGEVFYTEYLHFSFDQPVYLKEMYSYENVGVGIVVGVRAKDNTTNSWKRLYLGEADVPLREDEYLVQKPPGMCGTWFLTTELFLELDTCNRAGWNEIDAVLLVGTLDPNTGIVPINSSIVYVPGNNFTGVDSFQFKLTDCPGNRFRRTDTFTTHIEVNPAPLTDIVQLESEENSQTSLALSGTGPWQITSSPMHGELFQGKVLVNYDVVDFPSIVYIPDETLCSARGSSYEDTFAVVSKTTLGKPVTYIVRGCKQKTVFPTWVFGIVGAVVVIIGIVVLWFTTKQQRKMTALYNNNRVATECADAIAWMRLDEVSYLSKLPNPNKIQRAFIKIINTLEEYKNYMPSSLLVESESESEASSDRCSTVQSEKAGSSAGTIEIEHLLIYK
eukprot:TRINITY_DN5001_c1_g1_i8.p1 TRINITY_DN5001_c1_g1~~TRINITY_DN5001_c1_g1_i8.p1  ORF type:complete len:1037 (+),score=148.50 TRINITY_DN5001_c1_g1_i8:54-3113(+)